MSNPTLTKIMWARVLLHNKLLTPDQWFACLMQNAHAANQSIEKTLMAKRLLSTRHVEMIRPKIAQLVAKHAHEYEPAEHARAKAASVAAVEPGALEASDLAARLKLHADKVAPAAPPAAAAAAAASNETVYCDDGTIELSDDEVHEALNKGNEVTWATETGVGSEEAPVTMNQLSSAAQRRKQSVDDDDAIPLAE